MRIGSEYMRGCSLAVYRELWARGLPKLLVWPHVSSHEIRPQVSLQHTIWGESTLRARHSLWQNRIHFEIFHFHSYSDCLCPEKLGN